MLDISEEEMTIYNKLKRQNGEKFTQAIKSTRPPYWCMNVRWMYYYTLDVIPMILPKLSEALHAIILPDAEKVANSECPLKLLSDAGYDAYIVTDQNHWDSIKNTARQMKGSARFGTDRYKVIILLTR